MRPFGSRPAVLPALATLTGVASAVFAPWPGGATIVGWAALAAVVVLVRLRSSTWARPAALLALAAASHGWAAIVADERLRPHPECIAPAWRAAPSSASASTLASTVRVEGRLVADAAPSDRGIVLRLRLAVCGGATLTRRPLAIVTVQGSLAQENALAWTAGRTVRIAAALRAPALALNPGVDERTARLARDADLTGTVKSPALVELLRRGTRLSESAAWVRAWVRRAIDRRISPLDPQGGAITTAILIGDRAGLDEDLEEQLRRAGTYHVMAISGGNIALLVAALVLAGRAVGAPRALWMPCVAATVTAYAYIVGAEASVVRATAMAVVYLTVAPLDLRTDALNILAFIGCTMLWIDPLSVLDVGVWLTCGATLGILLFTRPIAAALCGPLTPHVSVRQMAWVSVPLELVAATIAAEALLWPVAATSFSQVTLVGLVANLAAVPLMTMVQIGGLLTLAMELVAAPAAMWARCTAWAARLLVMSASLADLLPMLVRSVPPPPWWLVAVYLGGVGWWRHSPSLAGRSAAALVATAAVAAAVAGWPAPLGRATPRQHLPADMPPWSSLLAVTFLDVGQGDAALVHTPSGHSLLVDAGGSPGTRFDVGARVVAPALWAFGVRRLSYVLVTHGDPDHAGGTASVVRAFRPHEIWEGVPMPDGLLQREIARAAAEVGAARRQVQTGDELRLGDVDVRVLHPPRPDWERQRVRNDDSVVLDLRYGATSIVLTGDIGTEIEDSLSDWTSPARVRVLKVAHHGSRTSTSGAWLARLAPAAGVISAGRANPFGHPAPEVVERLRLAGASVWRTDVEGAVTVASDGETVWVLAHRGRRERLPPAPPRSAAAPVP